MSQTLVVTRFQLAPSTQMGSLARAQHLILGQRSKVQMSLQSMLMILFYMLQMNPQALCPIDKNGTVGTCTASNPGSTLVNPIAIALNRDNTYAYITTGNNVASCSINADASLGTCSILSPGTSFQLGFGKMALNAANTYAYIVNQTTNNVATCTVNANSTLGACAFSDPGSIFNNPQGVAIR
jgi:hypothetical protein